MDKKPLTTADGEVPEITKEQFARFRPSREVVPDIVERARRHRGPQKAPTKKSISIRLDADLVEHFRATGRGGQTRLNQTLRKAVFG